MDTMPSNPPAVGDIVRILPQYCDDPREAGMRFTLVEDRGERALIELVCDWQIKPTQSVLKNMLARG
jgi:hypothetical protein